MNNRIQIRVLSRLELCCRRHIFCRPRRANSTTAKCTTRQPLSKDEITELLSRPTWSVKALRPTEQQIESSDEVSIQQVHHLLRLSALPAPETPEDEARILRDLHTQLHFVREIQKVDTSGVEPLRAIRDESPEAQRENEINLAALKPALEEETLVGKYHKRIRRRTDIKHDAAEAENWDLLGQAPKRVGRFIIVESAERDT